MARLTAKNLLGVKYSLATDLVSLISGSSDASFNPSTGVVTLKKVTYDSATEQYSTVDYTIDLSTLVKVAENKGLEVSGNTVSLSYDNSTLQITAETGTNGKLAVADSVMNRLSAVEGKFGTLTANKVVKVDSTGAKVESADYDYDDVVTDTADAALADGSLVVGTGSGLAIKDASISASNLVINSTGAATAAEKLIVSAGADKSVKSSELAVLKQGSDTESKITADDTTVPTTKAVKVAIDDITSKAIGVAEGKGIDITTDGTTKTLNAELRLVKLGTPTTGYAASYKLQYLKAGGTSGTAADYVDYGDHSATIDIMKDKFLKSATFGWAHVELANLPTDTAPTAAQWTTTKDATASAVNKPTIQFIVYTSSEPDSESALQYTYVDCESLFHDYTGTGNISVNASTNVISFNGGWSVAGKLAQTKANGELEYLDVTAADLVTESADAASSGLVMLSGGADKSVAASAYSIDSSTTTVAGTANTIPLAAAVKADLDKKATSEALNTEIANASAAEQILYSNEVAINNALGATFNVSDQEVTLAAGTYGIFTVAVSGGKVTITASAGSVVGAHRIVSVYNQAGELLYPDVTYNRTTKVATIVADYGTTEGLEGSGDTAYVVSYTIPTVKATLTQPTDR